MPTTSQLDHIQILLSDMAWLFHEAINFEARFVGDEAKGAANRALSV